MSPAVWIVIGVVAVVWFAVVYLLACLEPPVEPAEFGAQCLCGHAFAEHRTQTGIEGSPCFAPNAAYPGLCDCPAFEPSDIRPTVPDRLALVPECQHAAYTTDGNGAPLECVECGEELAE